MWNLNVKVIKAGTSTIDPGNSASPIQVGLKHQLGIGGGSSVVVIREQQGSGVRSIFFAFCAIVNVVQ
jgi:hypothetical protein